MRKCFSIFFLVMLILCIHNYDAQAEIINEGNIVSAEEDSTLILNNGSNIAEYSSANISPVFTSIQSTLSDNGNGYLKAYASTYAYDTVQQLGFTIFFQALSSGQWVNFDSVNISGINSSFISDYRFKVVAPARYYRVYVRHFIVDNEVTYFAYSTSNTVYMK